MDDVDEGDAQTNSVNWQLRPKLISQKLWGNPLDLSVRRLEILASYLIQPVQLEKNLGSNGGKVSARIRGMEKCRNTRVEKRLGTPAS